MVNVRALFRSASILPFVVASAAATPVVMTGEDALSFATRLAADARLDEADSILRTLAGGDPRAVDMRAVDRLAAKIAYQRGDHARAIEILQAVVAATPEDWRIRYDLAHIAMEKRQDRLAQRHLREILSIENDPAVTKKVRRDLATISERRLFRARFRASAVPSTNINTAPRAETFDFAGVIPFALSEEARAQSGIGVNWSVGGQFAPPLGNGFLGHVAVNGALTDHSHASFDQLSLGGELGVQRQFGPRVGGVRAALSTSYEERRLGGDPYSSAPGVKLSISSILSQRTAMRLEASVQDVSYSNRKDRDGLVSTLSASMQHAYSPRVRLSGMAAYTREAAVITTEANHQYSLSTGVQFAAPLGIRLGIHPTVYYRAYDAVAFAYGVKRQDWTADIATSIGHRNITLNGFHPAFVYRYTDNDSTVELFSYDRHAVDIAFSRAF